MVPARSVLPGRASDTVRAGPSTGRPRLRSGSRCSGKVPQDALAAPFLTQVGVTSATSAADVVTALRDAGDRSLHALIFHSDHLELSDQFDAFSGYEKSVTNLSWSYAALLSAVRARKAI